MPAWQIYRPKIDFALGERVHVQRSLTRSKSGKVFKATISTSNGFRTLWCKIHSVEPGREIKLYLADEESRDDDNMESQDDESQEDEPMGEASCSTSATPQRASETGRHRLGSEVNPDFPRVSSSLVLDQQQQQQFEYELIVIGGGAGGLACSKEAMLCGATKVAVLDYKRSFEKTNWGAGGTCVNSDCMPMKMMNHAAHLGEAIGVCFSTFY